MNYCPKCGFEVRDMKFCPKCGFELIKAKDKNSGETFAEATAIGVDYRALLLESKADHYLPIFDRMNEKSHASWNWCAFFFGPMWFAYRKLYGWAAIVFFSQIILGVIFGLMSSAESEIAFRLVLLIIAGIFAQRADYELKRRIDRLILEMPSDESARRIYIQKKGGTSAGGLIIALAAVILIRVISVMIVGLAGASQY